MPIKSFASPLVAEFFYGGKLKKKCAWSGISGIVRRKLDMLHYAKVLSDLKAPPGNRLEPLRGDLHGLYSIRINEKWRIVFAWSDNGPERVDVVDYH